MFFNYISKYQLPSWLEIELRTEKDCIYVYIHSKIHMNKTFKVSWQYGLDFTSEKILNDPQLFQLIRKKYGLTLKTILTSE